jgi:hypothetical protein
MAKRFSTIEKWDDLWFSELQPISKLLFLFLVDKCDNAGFVEINPRLHSFIIGISKQEYLDSLQTLDKVLVWSVSGEKIWLKNFIFYQNNLPLNIENNAHKQIINLLKQNIELFDFDFSNILPNLAPYQPLIRDLGNGNGKGIGNGIGKGNGNNLNGVMHEISKLSLVMQSEDSWLESIARKYKCSITFATDKILDFITHLEAQGEESKTLQDAKSHYDNWFRIQKDLKLKQKNGTFRKAGQPITDDEILAAVTKKYGIVNLNT